MSLLLLLTGVSAPFVGKGNRKRQVAFEEKYYDQIQENRKRILRDDMEIVDIIAIITKSGIL